MLLRECIYQGIRRSILRCELRPGQVLREQTLAERYRVSRSPVRDALLRLEQEGLVTVLPREGYVIRPVTARDRAEIQQLRLLIEPACAVAAAGLDDAALRGLDRFRWRSNGTADQAVFIEYDGAFHTMIAELSGNYRMAMIGRNLIEHLIRFLRTSVDPLEPPVMSDAAVQHAAIIDAIQAHDAKAAHDRALAHVRAFGME